MLREEVDSSRGFGCRVSDGWSGVGRGVERCTAVPDFGGVLCVFAFLCVLPVEINKVRMSQPAGFEARAEFAKDLGALG